jgi:hypothetical protein
MTNNFLEAIVHTILYEGYILYPYRASSPKNQHERFTFGRIYPQSYSQTDSGHELFQIQSDVLLRVDEEAPELQISLGFLQPIHREIGLLSEPLARLPRAEELRLKVVPKLEVDGKIYQEWMEATERQIPVTLAESSESIAAPFHFEAERSLEPILNDHGLIVAVIQRVQSAIAGTITAKAVRLNRSLFKISVTARNESPVQESGEGVAEKILMSTFASAHLIFQTQRGEFISLLEPPKGVEAFAAQCQNVGVWPVLVGNKAKGERSTMLASPIILYDYPEIAPDSVGDFFDGTEIDEMLTLRVMTLTDSEKTEIQLDGFSRRILERTHSLDEKSMQKLHGGMRPANSSVEEFFNPVRAIKTVRVGGVELTTGDKVIIRPKRRADAIDLMLAGKKAVIEALEQDAEGEIHLALILDDDPGGDLGLERQTGHRFFYRSDEVEPCPQEVST